MRNTVTSVLAVLAMAVLFTAGCGKEEGLRITQIEPKKGTYLGGDTVTIHGSGFQADGARDVTVYFGDNQAKVLAFEGDGQLRVRVPAGERGKTVEVTMIFNDARQFTYPDAYTYIEPSDIKVDDLIKKDP